MCWRGRVSECVGDEGVSVQEQVGFRGENAQPSEGAVAVHTSANGHTLLGQTTSWRHAQCVTQ